MNTDLSQEEHPFDMKHQNPAFSAIAVRELTEIFVEKSVEVGRLDVEC